jgi:hypothetical protein
MYNKLPTFSKPVIQLEILNYNLFLCARAGFPLYRFCAAPVFVGNPCASSGRSRLPTNTRSSLQQGAAPILGAASVVSG